MLCSRILLVAPALCFWFAPAGAAQVTWRPTPVLGSRLQHSLAFDRVRRTVQLVGGAPSDDIWEWSGFNWRTVPLAARPSGRQGQAIAYDQARGRLVLFGGYQYSPGAYLADTWEFDGTRWLQRTPARSPSPRVWHTMAYDSRRGAIVLFGGHDGTASLGETWTWDGTNWTLLSPSLAPSPRIGHGMAEDPLRGRIVLFSGVSATNTVPLGDTWEWDGATWHRSTPASSPGSLAVGGGMAWHGASARVVVFGGGSMGSLSQATWEWDGSDWVRRYPSHVPSARTTVLADDPARGRVVLFGGVQADDTWEWDGQDWIPAAPMATPAYRLGAGMAFDEARGRSVLFGGGFGQPPYGDTWVSDGEFWVPRSPAASPPARLAMGMTYDARRSCVVLFGGLVGPSYVYGSDTWEWDGSTWAQRRPSLAPSARAWTALAFDERAGRTLLFGGSGSNGAMNDTWEWDGTAWLQRSPAHAPPAVSVPAAYDAARARIVLLTPSSATWEWDGTDWSARFPVVSPTPRGGFGLAYDRDRQRVVMFGGSSNSVFRYSDTWEWDGTVWIERQPAIAPPARHSHAMAYDTVRRMTVIVGGDTGTVLDSWQYGPTDPACYVPYGRGCLGTAGMPALSAASLPWLASPLVLVVTPLPSAASGLVFLGASQQAWLGIPLPLGLDFAGMPGCALLASADLALPFSAAGGLGTVSIPIPGDRRLLGASLFGQGLILDPLANPAGVTMSNAGELVIGSR